MCIKKQPNNVYFFSLIFIYFYFTFNLVLYIYPVDWF